MNIDSALCQPLVLCDLSMFYLEYLFTYACQLTSFLLYEKLAVNISNNTVVM